MQNAAQWPALFQGRILFPQRIRKVRQCGKREVATCLGALLKQIRARGIKARKEKVWVITGDLLPREETLK